MTKAIQALDTLKSLRLRVLAFVSCPCGALTPAARGVTTRDALHHARALAATAGWRREGGRWLCPGCWRFLLGAGEERAEKSTSGASFVIYR